MAAPRSHTDEPGDGERPTDPAQMADYSIEGDMFGVLVDIDDSSVTGVPFRGNDYIAGLVGRWPSQFIGFASIDPHQGKLAVRELERAARDLGLRGLKLHPSVQRFFPNDRAHFPLSDRVLYGSDYPTLLPDRWLRDWEQVGFRHEVRRGILFDNANRLLGLGLEFSG